MQKVRSPTYAENYIDLARTVVLNVITDPSETFSELTPSNEQIIYPKSDKRIPSYSKSLPIIISPHSTKIGQ